VQPHGYGKFMLDGVGQWAHRVAWALAFGPIPAGMHVCHKCDNPRCVRPAHLFLGTVTDNQRDSVRKGRHIKGEAVGNAKLTEAQVKDIRHRFRAGTTQRELAASYGVAQTAVSAIVRRVTWAHVA
jgi:hypothetical protein